MRDESALRESESRLRKAQQERETYLAQLEAVLEHLNEGLVICDLDGKLFHWNPAALAVHGFRTMEECGRLLPEFTQFFELSTPEGQTIPVDQWPLARILAGQDLRNLELQVRHRQQGWERTFNYGGSLARDKTGAPILAVVSVSDVTEPRRAERALAESRADLSRAQAVASVGSWRLDVRNNELLWSDETHRIFGIPRGAPLRYETFLETIHPEDRALVDKEWLAALDGAPYSVEHRILVGDTVKWVREVAELEFDAEGNLQGGFGTAQDVTERKLVEAALRESEERFRQLADSMPQLIWTANPDGEVDYYNRRREEFRGLEQAEGGRWNWTPVLHPDDQARTREAWEHSIRTGSVYDIEHRVQRADGSICWVLSRGVPVRDAEGRVTKWYGTATDVDARKKAEEALETHARAAEAANVAKSQFLASISHELRTPMNAILGMTDLALGEPLSPSVRDYLQTARESADMLLELLNEVLDFSRIESGRFELDSVSFSPQEAVEQVVRTLSLRAYEKGLELVYDPRDELPEAVLGDPLRLRQVLMNLVGNAIKFTSRGEVLVEVSLAQKTARAVSLQFSVSDTGVGIAPEDQERIFALFTQADSSTTRRFGGSGLGLAISQKLVALMGGRIDVISQVGLGSTFSFTITLPIAPRAADSVSISLPDLEAFRDVPVLVVADHATSRRVLQHMLASWSMRADSAPDVPAALASIHQAAAAGNGYRVVVAEGVMPNINGFTLAEWLQGNTRLAGAIILMLSATDRQAYAEPCRQTQALTLDKPISRSGLFNIMARALGVEGHGLPLRPAKPRVVSAAPVRKLRILLAEDTPANQKLVLHILGKRGHEIEVAPNGRVALEAVRRQDFDAVLMDVQMPELDGFAATRTIRGLPDPDKSCLPIIAMTAHALKGDDERCLEAGMTAYLSKPINGDAMIDLVERLARSGDPLDAPTGGPVEAPGEAPVEAPLHDAAPSPAETQSGRTLHKPRRSGKRPAVQGNRSTPAGTETRPALAERGQAQAPKPPVGPAEAPVFDRDEAVRRCYGRLDIFQQLVAWLYEETDGLIDLMRASLARGDLAELADHAHKLKGTIIYLAAGPATAAASRLEEIVRSGNLAPAGEAMDRLEREIASLRKVMAPLREGR